MIRAACLASLVALASIIGHAQSTPARFSISGEVQDQTGAAIVDARVELSGVGAPGAQSTTTDQAGRFEFKRIASGQYQLRVSDQGFEPAVLKVTVSPQPPTPLQVVMSIASIRQETTVTSEPAKISTEASDNKDTAALSEQSLSNLPVFDQDYISAAAGLHDATRFIHRRAPRD